MGPRALAWTLYNFNYSGEVSELSEFLLQEKQEEFQKLIQNDYEMV